MTARVSSLFGLLIRSCVAWLVIAAVVISHG